jgi:hypothetical protein
MSYGITSKLLQEVLPIDQPINTSIRSPFASTVADVAERLERELGDE